MKILIKNVVALTLDENSSIKKDCFIGITDGRIDFIEDSNSKKVNEFVADKIIDAKGRIAMPGFANGHVHSSMTILRNFGDDLPLNDWLFNCIIPTENKFTDDDIYWGGMLGVIEQLKCGVTCFADMYESTDIMIDIVTKSGIRCNVSGPPVHSPVDCSYQDYVNHLKKYNNFNDGLVKEYGIIHSIYTYSEEKIKARVAAAKEANTGIHIHISEAPFEQEMIWEKYKKTPIQQLAEWGVFDVPTIAAHCVHLSDNDFNILKEKNVNVIHCPSSNLKLASGFAPVPRLLKEGINVGIGTDGVSSNSNLNIIEELHLASLIHKAHTMNPLAVTAKEVVNMATLNGLKAMGFDKNIGALKVGNKADLIIIDTDKAHLTPLRDIYSAIAYSMQGSDVDTVIVNGKVVMENREFEHLDEEKIKFEVKSAAKRLIG